MKKRTPQGIALILLLVLAPILINKYYLNREETTSIGAILNVKTHDMNKNLPIDIDNNTRFDKVIYIPEKQIQFNYTIHNLPKGNFDLKTMVDSVGFELLKTIKQDPNFKLLRDSNVILTFQYCDTLGRIINKFNFNSTDYK